MQDDSSRIDRNSKLRKSEEDAETLRRIERTSASINSCDNSRINDNEREKETREEEVIGLIARSWSGLLPPPEDFNAYNKETQKCLLEWNNVQIVDESRRQDKTIELSRIESKRKSYLSFLTNIVPILVSGVAFIITRDVNSLWFLSVPCVTIGANIIIVVKNKNE